MSNQDKLQYQLEQKQKQIELNKLAAQKMLSYLLTPSCTHKITTNTYSRNIIL